MMQAQEPGKRIVSKGTYAVIRLGQGSIYVSGMAFMVISGLCFLTAISCGVQILTGAGLLMRMMGTTPCVETSIYGTAMCLMAGTTYLFGKAGYVAVTKAERLLDGIPLTCETANLSAPDSLVRASQQPVQEQEAVLLRAATQTQDTHEEQLVSKNRYFPAALTFI